MKKIPTIFVRDTSGKRPVITPEWYRECLWVRDGEGIATRKWDGSACMVRGGIFYKRLEWDAQKGAPPATWLHHDFDPSAKSGHGWTLVSDGPDDWMHRFAAEEAKTLPDGTYELCGPKMGKNLERLDGYKLLPHGNVTLDVPRDFGGIREWLAANVLEGVVWHHPDGRMAKIKRRDFGLAW